VKAGGAVPKVDPGAEGGGAKGKALCAELNVKWAGRRSQVWGRPAKS
jgi:hypothetical protein